MKNIVLAFIIISCVVQRLDAQNDTKEISLSLQNFEVSDGSKAVFEKFQGRETVILNGKLKLKNQQFSNGIISVDIYANSARSFAGIIFRQQNNTLEEVYMRLHKSTQADALQYTPVFHGESNWQLYNYIQANVEFKTKGWNNLRIVINDTVALVFVNNEKVLTVNNLRTDNKTGSIGLFALFNNRFSNFKFVKKNLDLTPVKEAIEKENPNLITKWNITKAILYDENLLNPRKFSKEKYSTVSTEKTGLLPISKYIQKPSSGNLEGNKEVYTIASSIIEIDSKQVMQFSFDYSDKIRIYLNQKLLFSGNNAFRLKGIQHEGHLNVNANTIYLNLKKGKNELHCVVIDRANGWGLIGQLKRM